MLEGTSSMPVSLRVPADLIEILDKIAAVLEVLDVQEGIAELDRGEGIPFEEAMAQWEEIIAKAEAKRGAD